MTVILLNDIEGNEITVDDNDIYLDYVYEQYKIGNYETYEFCYEHRWFVILCPLNNIWYTLHDVEQVDSYIRSKEKPIYFYNFMIFYNNEKNVSEIIRDIKIYERGNEINGRVYTLNGFCYYTDNNTKDTFILSKSDREFYIPRSFKIKEEIKNITIIKEYNDKFLVFKSDNKYYILEESFHMWAYEIETIPETYEDAKNMYFAVY